MISFYTHFSAKKIAIMLKDGELRVDNPVQRSFVWSIAQRSDLIDTILREWVIPPLYLEKSNEGKVKSRDIYDVLDGQQRCLTVATYYNDEWALTDVDPIEIDGKVYDIDGLLFSELPEKLQEVFNECHLPVFYVENLTQDEKTVMFRKFNNGKALSTNDMTVAYCGDLETVTDLSKHEVFNKLLTATGKKNKRYVSYIMKFYRMLHEDVMDISFDSKDFRPYCKDVKFSDDDKQEMIEILDYISNLLDFAKPTTKSLPEIKETYKKLKKEVHLVSLIPYIKKAIANGYDIEQFWTFCFEFFKNPSVTYEKASRTDTSKNHSVVYRDTELEEKWKEFTGKHEPHIVVVNIKDDEETNDNENEIATQSCSDEYSENNCTYVTNNDNMRDPNDMNLDNDYEDYEDEELGYDYWDWA